MIDYFKKYYIDVFDVKTITVENHIKRIERYHNYRAPTPTCLTSIPSEYRKIICDNEIRSNAIFQTLEYLGYKKKLYWIIYDKISIFIRKVFQKRNEIMGSTLRYVNGFKINEYSPLKTKWLRFYDYSLRPYILFPKCIYLVIKNKSKHYN